MGEGLLPFFIYFAIFLLFILRKKKKKGSDSVERPPPVKAPPPKRSHRAETVQKQVLKKPPKVVPSSYEVEKRNTKPVLQKNWQGKEGLQQAFILSEVLKKVDEREFF